MSAPPTSVIGKFGEYFATRWLKDKGYDVRNFSRLMIILKWGSENFEEPLPEPEKRRRRIQSLETRIPILEQRISDVEHADHPENLYREWVETERQRLLAMSRALQDLKDGKPLAEVDERSPQMRLRYPAEDWGFQKDVRSQSEARSYLGNKLKDFLRLVEECEKLRQEELGGALFPDIIAKKNGEFYVIEVKANEAVLAPLQWKALDLARKCEFNTKIVRVKFSADCFEEMHDHRKDG